MADPYLVLQEVYGCCKRDAGPSLSKDDVEVTTSGNSISFRIMTLTLNSKPLLRASCLPTVWAICYQRTWDIELYNA